MSQPKQQQPAIADTAAGNGTVARTSPGVMGPTTYIDPSADTVLRSRDGRDFRVHGWMVKANW
jgi:hypothetical protein